MAETTKIELVTPGRVVVSKSVEMVVIPGSEGFFGVLPRHSALLANLQRGVVEVYEGGEVTDRLMIDGGIADVTPESVTILTERAEDLNKVNAQEIGERAKSSADVEFDFLKDVEAAL
jgi:F-type H+-transporting ATPase subunit epsilon